MEFLQFGNKGYNLLSRALVNAILIYLFVVVWVKFTNTFFAINGGDQYIDPFHSQSILLNFIQGVVIAPLLYVLIFQALITRLIILIVKYYFPLNLNETGIRNFTSIIILACLLLSPIYNFPYRLIVVFPVGYTISGLYVNYYLSEGSKQAFLLTWLTLTFMLLGAFLRSYLVP